MFRIGPTYQHLASPQIGCTCCSVLSRRSVLAGLSVAAAGLTLSGRLASAAAAEPSRSILFFLVKVFNGKAALPAPMNILVRGNTIAAISQAALPADANANAVVISGEGRTLMPGLIDAHAHMTFWNMPFAQLNAGDPAYLQIRMAAGAKDMLLAGSTSVRDPGDRHST